MSIVNVMVECRITACTVLTGTPAIANHAPHVCRKQWRSIVSPSWFVAARKSLCSRCKRSSGSPFASDRRKQNFEARHGECHVELDALAALHPGEFERIVSEAFADYRDESLAGELDDAHADATSNAEDAWEETTAHVQSKLDDLLDRVNAVSDTYTPEVDKLRNAMDAELAPLREEMEELKRWANEECAEAENHLHVDLPIRPSAEPAAEAEADHWLYDSTRTYGDQLEHFHTHQNGELE